MRFYKRKYKSKKEGILLMNLHLCLQ